MKALEVQRAAFLEALRARRYSPATIQGCGWSLDAFLRFLAAHGQDHPACHPLGVGKGDRGITDVREVTRQTVRDYQVWMAERRFATRTVLGRLGALRGFFAHLEATDAILMNPCEDMRLPKLEARLPRRVLSLKEARAVLNAPDTQRKVGIRDKAMLELFYSTGLRLGEMTRLTIHDVDPRHGLVRVNQGKGARDRVVPMGRKACDYAREYLKEVRSVWSKERRDERALWLSSKTPHLPLAACSIKQMVAHHGKSAKLSRPLSPHVWRHTCATHLVAAGANIAHVQRLLGHRSLQSTQIYTRVSIPEIKKTFRRAHPRERRASRFTPHATRKG
ncbi:MAG: tyrosine-type recombinase/integrase [Betaproteobacteria bacterium]|nr:tyrosine-type recombinase/integrase [Betaproteobacteria bacterium]